ncbi:MAG: hypothetical protein JXA42_00565 [Anaerolineales bacterium]|nr:hypothetical protein [Anaerolineales bacterium]
MKTIKPVMLFVLSAFLLTACLFKPDISELQSIESNQISWQTFSSEIYDFTVRIPSTWQVIEPPTAKYPNANDEVWLVSESLPQPQTGSRADIVLIFTQEDPSYKWRSEYFDEYKSETVWLGDIQAKKISGINKESRYSEIVVLANIGDFYIQALPNQSNASMEYFDQVISSLRFVQAKSPTPPPSITSGPANSDERVIEYKGTSLTFPASLAEGASAQQIDASVDPSGFIYNDVPGHVRFDFINPYTVQAPFAGFQPIWTPWLNHQNSANPEIQPQIFIFPTRGYEEICPLAGERISALKALLDGGAVSAGVELPVLPAFNSAQDLRSQVKPLAFQGGRGLRFITRYSQGVEPVANPAIFYTFQGLTEDGNLYVAAFFPLYISSLPDQVQVEDWESFSANYSAYMSETTAALDQLASAEFTPDLALLDSVITSLQEDSDNDLFSQ